MLCLRTWSICRWECDKHPSLSDVNVSLFFFFFFALSLSVVYEWSLNKWIMISLLKIGLLRALDFSISSLTSFQSPISRLIFQVHLFYPLLLFFLFWVECITVCPASLFVVQLEHSPLWFPPCYSTRCLLWRLPCALVVECLLPPSSEPAGISRCFRWVVAHKDSASGFKEETRSCGNYF